MLVKIHGVFVPLTELTQIPKNTVINALHGTLSLTTRRRRRVSRPRCRREGQEAQVASPKRRRAVQRRVFKLNQTTAGAGKGLVTLALVENAFKGAPSYALCTTGKKAGDASAAAVSTKVLQLLHASAKGKFKTSGATAQPPSAAPNGRSRTAATAPSPTTSPTP